MGVNGIYGLSGSGLDIESMVKAGMVSKQNEYDRMYKKEVSNTWAKESYNEIYTDLFKYKNNTLYDYKLESYMNAMSATSSNESLVTATANGAAAAMAHKVEVSSLARNAYVLTKDTVQREGTTAGSIYLRDVMFGGLTEKAGDKNTYVVAKNHDYSIADGVSYKDKDGVVHNCTSITYDETKKTYSINGLADPISEEDFKKGTFILAKAKSDGTLHDTETVEVSAAKVKIKDGVLTAATQLEEVNATDTAVCFKLSDGKEESVVTYTYKDLLEDGGKTLYDLATDSTKETNITAKYDSVTDSISFYNKDGGKENTISFTAMKLDSEGKPEKADNFDRNTAKLLTNLQLAEYDGNELKDAINFGVDAGEGKDYRKEVTVGGDNGSVKIDGKSYDNLTSNKTTVAGVTYTFNDMKVGTTVTIAVSQDTDTIIERVQKFVDDYNEIIDMLNDKYNEAKYSDYQPLTKAQEESMSETQIEKWNEKAKSGLLYHDNNIRQIISEMREAIYTPITSINSKYNCASAIGISSSDNKGHLSLDTDKLKAAIAADPDCVNNIFTTYEEEKKRVVDPKTGEVTYKATGKNVFSGTGLAWRLNDVMTKSISTISSYAGTTADVNDESTLGKLITNLQTKMSNFKTMMDAFEDQLYKKYDSLESAIMKLSMQLSTVTGGNNQ